MVAAGSAHTCCVTASGVVWCWGLGERGLPAHGAATGADDDEIPRRPDKLLPSVFGGVPAVMVACGRDFTLVLTTRGKVWSFGQNTDGQLGVGDFDVRSQAAQAGDARFQARTFVMVAAGTAHSIAADDRGAVYTWGRNEASALGLRDEDGGGEALRRECCPRAVQIGPDSEELAVFVAAGGNCSMALSDMDRVWAWGANRRGQLGLDTREDAEFPTMVLAKPGLELFATMVACGGRHSLFVTTGGQLLASGADVLSDGNGVRYDAWAPTALDAPFATKCNVTCASAGEEHSAVVDDLGNLYTWGAGQFAYGAREYGGREFASGVGHGAARTSAPTLIKRQLLAGRRVGWFHALPRVRFEAFALGAHLRLNPAPAGQRCLVHALPDNALQMLRHVARRTPEGKTARLPGLARLLGAGPDYQPVAPRR